MNFNVISLILQIFDIERSKTPPIIPPRLPADHRLVRGDDDFDYRGIEDTLRAAPQPVGGDYEATALDQRQSDLYKELLEMGDVDIADIKFGKKINQVENIDHIHRRLEMCELIIILDVLIRNGAFLLRKVFRSRFGIIFLLSTGR